MKIAMNDFARRQTKESSFSYYSGSEAELIALVEDGFSLAKPGYRDGVLEVPVFPECFYTSIVRLDDGAELIGKFEPRADGELSRKTMRAVKGHKLPAGSVVVIIYTHALLVEDNQASTDAEYEIVSINAALDAEASPMAPETLMRNHYGEPGGTNSEMTHEEFAVALKVSRDYWRDKALLA